MLTVALLLVCLGGLSGCDSKPADGTMVQDGGTVSEEQKSKVASYYNLLSAHPGRDFSEYPVA
jgi:hypothetical protein